MKKMYDGDPSHRQQLSTYRSLANRETAILTEEEGTWELLDEAQFPSGDNTEGVVFNRLLHESLREPLDSLPIRHRRALQWHALDDKTFDEIGDKLGVTPARVDQIIRQARHALLKNPNVRQLKDFLEE